MSTERTPPSSPGTPTELQQLQAALAAGVITPELFATLSAQLRSAELAASAPEPASASPGASASDVELPSLLDMFTEASAAPVSPPPGRPAPASPPRPSAADIAARQRIEEHLAQLRQPAAPLAAPVAPNPAPTPTPTPTPNFYPAPSAPAPTPTFYPPHPLVEAASPPARPTGPAAGAGRAAPAAGGGSRWLWVLLLGLAVAGALAYFFVQNSHPDESLTSPGVPAAAPAPAEAAAPPLAKKGNKSAKKKRKAKPAAAAAASSNTQAPPAAVALAQPAAPAAVAAHEVPATSQPIAAAPEAGDDAATIKVREVLAAYYADLHAPPMHASQYFAPQVERLYIQQNLMPAAIDAELTRSFFPDNQQAVAQIVPGTLRVSPAVADGSRTAIFTEEMRLYRVSKQQFQRLRTRVRVRFNADYQIAYMRQEKLLANTFE